MNTVLVLAYLDPGTGSIVIQALVGGVLGGLLVIKLFWRKIVAFLTGKRGAGDTADRPAENAPSGKH
jgi:hypothetical protein